MAALTPACVWRIGDELVVELDDRFGPPVDAYVNGSQVWLRDDGPGGITLEWRLHPVAGFVRPTGVGVHDLFGEVAWALATEEPPVAPLHELWEGLEAFPAYGDEVEPPALAASATAALGLKPDAVGLVDHEVIGQQWEQTGGDFSVVSALFDQLAVPRSR